ncbi:hypothetical protein MMC17_004305 [Xylographa soralifera]|nr:hypothetical protein [Xylographa soralifera]
MASKRALRPLGMLNSSPSLHHGYRPPPLAQSTARALPFRPYPPTTIPLQRRWKSTTSTPAPQTAIPTSSTTSKPSTTPSPPIKPYTYEDILSLTHTPAPHTLLIDVRTPAETAHGRIPTAQELDITAHPDGLFLSGEEFEERFGWPKPDMGVELVFYCKAGVRSRVAARMARERGWRVGEFAGSWEEWVGRGGRVERG